MTIEEGPALSADAPPSASAALDRDELCAQLDWVRAVSRSLVRDPWRAEDVAQETLLAALAAPPRQAADAKQMRAWLGRVAFNLSRLGARRAARRHAREASVAKRETLPPVTEALESASTRRILDRAIAGLPEAHRRLIRLRYFEGLSTAEIAARVGTSELAVRKRLWRARTKLKEALERGARREPFFGLALVGLFGLRQPRTLAYVAAGAVATLGGLAWWQARLVPATVAPSVAAIAAPAAETQGTRRPAAPFVDDVGHDAEERLGQDPRRERVVVRAERGRELPPPAVLRGRVLDLENRPQGGLEIHLLGAPAEVLATSDAGGSFRLEAEAPLCLEAGSPERVTLVPARIERGFEDQPARIVVTRAADLRVHVEDERGAPVGAARVELECLPEAFAALDFPVRLASPRLAAADTDAHGRAELVALPRGTGLVLRVVADGFEPGELDSRTLGEEVWVTLVPERASLQLAGRVFHHDGRPAAGARVSLAEAATHADDRGRFRLPLRNVRPDSRLEARDPDGVSAPFVERSFGARVGPRLDVPAARPIPELDLFLGEPLAEVHGRLVGPEAGGWRVAAFAADHPVLEEDGREVPSATTVSTPNGAFHLALPAGPYDVYALAPGSAFACSARRLPSGIEWTLGLPTEFPVQPARARLVSDDGRSLARTPVAVVALLEAGARRLEWREFVSDDAGEIAFARDPELALALVVEHPHALGEFLWDGPGPLAHAPFPRPAYLALREVPPEITAARFLDRDGLSVDFRDAFGRATGVAGFRAGTGGVLEAPPAARWVEFEGASGAQRIPLDLVPGETLRIRP
jgi:RNA polymerase sigma-70 factor (ECF subfamily)